MKVSEVRFTFHEMICFKNDTIDNSNNKKRWIEKIKKQILY